MGKFSSTDFWLVAPMESGLCPSRHHHYNVAVINRTELISVGTTTAEKLEGTSCGVDADPFLFPPPSFPHLPVLLQPFPSQLFFPSPLKFSKLVREAL